MPLSQRRPLARSATPPATETSAATPSARWRVSATEQPLPPSATEAARSGTKIDGARPRRDMPGPGATAAPAPARAQVGDIRRRRCLPRVGARRFFGYRQQGMRLLASALLVTFAVAGAACGAATGGTSAPAADGV